MGVDVYVGTFVDRKGKQCAMPIADKANVELFAQFASIESGTLVTVAQVHEFFALEDKWVLLADKDQDEGQKYWVLWRDHPLHRYVRRFRPSSVLSSDLMLSNEFEYDGGRTCDPIYIRATLINMGYNNVTELLPLVRVIYWG